MIIAPTKANLIKSKETLNFSIKGYELLDKKRNVLIREMMGMINEAKTIQARIEDIFNESYDALKYANMTMGSNAVEDMAINIPMNENFKILKKSVMGVELPLVIDESVDISITYGMFRTNAALDISITKMNQMNKLIYELAQIENSVFKLAVEIKKTSKRANSLDKIQIPKYKGIVKYIQEVLEEKEREDFFRLKKVKSKKIVR
jgi:V/A-type H+-transporting ATPase subunit D